jgi:hypothetical protein
MANIYGEVRFRWMCIGRSMRRVEQHRDFTLNLATASPCGNVGAEVRVNHLLEVCL